MNYSKSFYSNHFKKRLEKNVMEKIFSEKLSILVTDHRLASQKAETLLMSNLVDFRYIEKGSELDGEIRKKYGVEEYPIAIVDGEFIGGIDELEHFFSFN